MNENPWEKLSELSQLRVVNAKNHNFFWIADIYKNFGLMIQCKEGLFTDSHKIKLKGIHIEIDQSTKPNKLLLLLRNKEDWQIFKVLCEDLISVANEYPKDSIMLENISKRLSRWQKLLQYDLKNPFSPQKQRGLFSELKVLINLVADQVGFDEAISNWTGPLFDKQDFILEHTAIEVKSYNSSKHKAIQITSLEQLHSEKKVFILACLGLTENPNGETVEDLVNLINSKIQYKTRIIFEERLEKYGYIPELKEPLLSLVVDNTTFYDVAEDFPKITPIDISSAIEKVNYSINLNECRDFRIEQSMINLIAVPRSVNSKTI